MHKILILIVVLPLTPKSQENPLDIFKPLENNVWYAEGKWGDGSLFRQEVSLEYSLDNTIIVVHSKGFTNKEQTEFGLRNYGIRQYDSKSGKIKFWEFDVFGNLTEGIVFQEGKDIIYQYSYEDTFITEMWIYKNETTYDFIVGIYENEKWKQKFLETQFKKKS